MSLLVQCVLFFLTTLAIAAWFFLFEMHGGWFLMLVCIATAEFLIRRYHFWRTGVESALWLGGLYAFIFSLPSSGRPEALLVLGAAAAIAGWRVRNAIFGTAALCFVVAYFHEVGAGVTALMFAVAVSLVALFGVTRVWRRPSTELLWQMLLVVMPVAGYVASRSGWPVFIALAVLLAFVGVRARIRVPLAAAAIAIAIAIVDLRLPFSPEAQLIAGGAAALCAATILTRALKRRDRGFVLDVPQQQSELEAILSVAPSIMPAPAAAPQGIGGGGQFGGAGSSGNF